MATNKGKDTAKSKAAGKDKKAAKANDDSLKGLEGLVADDAPVPKGGAGGAPDATEQQLQPDPNAPSMAILAQYVKDLSFENPNPINPPQIEGGRPPMEVKINIGINKIENEDNDDYEVALEIRVESKAEETVLFIAEISYAGLFRIRNIPEEQLKAILQIEAPRQIFPFARHILAEVTAFSGTAPVLLDPGIFAAVYQQMQQQAQNNEGAEAGAEEAKN